MHKFKNAPESGECINIVITLISRISTTTALQVTKHVIPCNCAASFLLLLLLFVALMHIPVFKRVYSEH